MGPGTGGIVGCKVGGDVGGDVGDAVGLDVGGAVGSCVGLFVGSSADDTDTGDRVGAGTGCGVGKSVGSFVGFDVGGAVGPVVGSAVGFGVGGGVGPGTGGIVGLGVGDAVGFDVGGAVGPGVGGLVGLSVGAGIGGRVTELIVKTNMLSSKHDAPVGGSASTRSVVVNAVVLSTQMSNRGSDSVTLVLSPGIKNVGDTMPSRSTVSPSRVPSTTVMSMFELPMLAISYVYSSGTMQSCTMLPTSHASSSKAPNVSFKNKSMSPLVSRVTV